MALPLSTAKMTGSRKPKKGKVISEYAGKASPINKQPANGASRRYKKRSKK